ncbi:S-layer homology domain-containing protein [candidate division KSB1 bacterium]|nr:S-layer homology domain-containing protein [candidate division KSB1 bacterium]
MNRHVRFITVVMLALFAMSLWGCGPKPIKEESVLDTPENHFSRGMVEFDKDNLTLAMKEFERAKALNPDYAEAYSGMGLVLAAQAVNTADVKAAEKMFDKAYDMADEGISKNDKSLDVHIIKGRIITMQRKGDDWVKNAAKEFEKATKINPNSDKAWYYLGITYKEGFEFGSAVDAFRKVVALKGEYAEQANSEWELVQKIERAKPGTKVGAKVALIGKIDRADLAVLLMEELKLMTLIEKKRPRVYDNSFQAPDDPTKMQATQVTSMEAATDISGHWAESWIKEAIDARIGGLEPYPDHTFKPDQPITRANYAKVMESVMIMVTGDESLATKYIGENSRFPDVRSSHYAYNAISLMVDRGIMKADKITGEFRLNDPMSGADALLAIRDFQNALRITF